MKTNKKNLSVKIKIKVRKDSFCYTRIHSPHLEVFTHFRPYTPNEQERIPKISLYKNALMPRKKKEGLHCLSNDCLVWFSFPHFDHPISDFPPLPKPRENSLSSRLASFIRQILIIIIRIPRDGIDLLERQVLQTRDFLQFPDFPTPEEQHAQGGGEIHEAREELGAQVRTGSSNDFQGDGLAERGREHDDEPDEVESGGDVFEPDDLGGDGRDGGPEGAGDAAADDGEEDEHAVAVGEDPDDKGQKPGEKRHQTGHVDAADAVAEVADGRAAEGLAEVQQRGDDRGLLRVQADGVGVVGQREDENDVGEQAEPAVAAEEKILGFFEQAIVEREL